MIGPRVRDQPMSRIPHRVPVSEFSSRSIEICVVAAFLNDFKFHFGCPVYIELGVVWQPSALS